MKITTIIRSLLPVIALGIVSAAHAQIGYQVSLLNNATGEPRANESVSVSVKITDSKGGVICEEVKNETTNDFGVLSMSVGNSETFAEADWNNLPFFIEASVGGHLIGRSQLLSVPIAEYAKHTGSLTKEILCSKKWSWKSEDGEVTNSLVFNKDGGATFTSIFDNRPFGSKIETETAYYRYYIEGNTVALYGDPTSFDSHSRSDDTYIILYIPSNNSIVVSGASSFK